MMKKTHIFAGAAATIPFINSSNIVLLPIALIGSFAADWDYIIGLKHRGITHTLLALLVSTALLCLYSINLGMLWGINYSIHLVLDSLTVTGIPLFYPISNKYIGLKLFKTRSAEDGFILILCIYIISCILGA